MVCQSCAVSSLYTVCVACSPCHLPSQFSCWPLSGEDKVTFSLGRTRLSNNGTDVSAGQLPSLFYCLGTEKDIVASKKSKEAPEVPEDYLVGISKRFSLKVTQVSEWLTEVACLYCGD